VFSADFAAFLRGADLSALVTAICFYTHMVMERYLTPQGDSAKSCTPVNESLVEIFSATLRPYRSLSRNGFTILMILFGGTCFLMGVFYTVAGAWPVFAFLGIDVILLFFAFQLNYRSARAFEEIRLFRDELIVRRVSPHGRVQELTFNPFWAKLDLSHDDEEKVTRIAIKTRSEEAVIGGFLNPDDKTSFAKAFGQALAEAKR
ncbi:MAG: DUF2244 domain-containing protein, partial [Pseudomonadota bacterium]